MGWLGSLLRNHVQLIVLGEVLALRVGIWCRNRESWRVLLFRGILLYCSSSVVFFHEVLADIEGIGIDFDFNLGLLPKAEACIRLRWLIRLLEGLPLFWSCQWLQR